MTPRIPLPQSLVGRFVTLEPLSRTHLEELHTAIGRPETWASGWGGGPAGYADGLAEFVEFAGRYFRWDARPFAVRLTAGPAAGRVVGTSTLGDFDLPREAAHLGWTAYDPRVWGSVVNPETKLLLLGHAFEHGFERVKLQANAENARSRAAILKLGATFEGVIRRESRRADGTWRDAAVHSILADEWPAVRDGLLARLDGASAPEVADR